MDFLISLVITAIMYMAFPFFKFYIVQDKKYSKQDFNKICIINSVIVATINLIIGINAIENYQVNFAPACIWYFVNYAVWPKMAMTKEALEQEKSAKKKMQKKEKDELKKIIILGIVAIVVTEIVVMLYTQ